MMKSKGIPVSVVHVGIDRNEIFGGKVMENENQRYWDDHHVCIPCHSSLTDEDVQRVIDAVKAGW
jgi:dTDP-4-amino-4,6-dideoxygalactose transaminase